MPRTIAIVLNWNKRATLEVMLESLLAAGPRDFDIVVVDNCSTDGSVEMLRERYPWIHQIVNAKNLGGTGGFNRGMQYALSHPKGYEFLWLLDNDVIVEPGAYHGLLQPFLDDPRMGMVGSTVLLLDDPNYAQETGVRIDRSTGAFIRSGEGPLDRNAPPRLYEADYAAACSLMTRASAVREVGLWDPAYFVNFDDIEWGLRFNRAGWRVVGTTGSLVRHESFNDRRAQNPVFNGYICSRNALYGFWRWARPPQSLRLFYRFFRGLRLAISAYEEEGCFDEARALRLAMRDFEDGRMGPPPDDLRLPPGATETPRNSLPKGYTRPLRRIALLARDNPDSCRAMHARLCEHFPMAYVETVVLAGTPELDRADLPNRRSIDISTAARRLMQSAFFPLHYDAVASPLSLYRYFFERLVPIHIRYNQDLTWWVARRSGLGATVRHLGQRVLISLRSLWQTLRTVARKPWEVDYHQFEEPDDLLIFESRNGSHWHERGKFGAPPSSARRMGMTVLHALLLPFAALTVMAVAVTMPLLAWVDRRRGRR